MYSDKGFDWSCAGVNLAEAAFTSNIIRGIKRTEISVSDEGLVSLTFLILCRNKRRDRVEIMLCKLAGFA